MIASLVNPHAPPMHENPALLDPMAALTGPERTLLRKLDAAGVALMAGHNGRYGWMLAGARYNSKPFNRFLALGLASVRREEAGVALRLTYTGRLVAERLRLKPIAGADPADD